MNHLRCAAGVLGLLALGFLPSASFAHSIGRSSLSLEFDRTEARAIWRAPMRDLDALIGLESAPERIASYVQSRVELEADGASCDMSARDSSLDGAMLRVEFAVTCPAAPH